MKEKKKTGKGKKLLGHLLLFAIGIAVGLAAGAFLAQGVDALLLLLPGLPFLAAYAILIATLILAVYLQLILHEGGHLIFGLLSGYRFSSFRIGSFMWVLLDGRLRCKRLKIAGTGGRCLMAPPDLVDGTIPVVLYNLGGVIVNLIAGLLFLALYLLFPAVPVLSMFASAMAAMGFFMALTNGIPIHTATVDNDGYNARALGKNKAAAAAFWQQMKVNEATAAGLRAAEMPEEWFPLPDAAQMHNSLIAGSAVLYCNRLIDQHRFAEADALLAKYLAMDSAMAGLHRSLALCDRLYMELIGENRREQVEAFLTKELEQFMKAMKTFPSVIRTRYAHARLHLKDEKKAAEYRRQFERCAKTYPYPSDMASERELMDIADEICAKRNGAE